MKKVGTYLKKHREKLDHSLEDMASRTKIHIQKLRDIEAGNEDALPAQVFYVGLVKSYARELKLDMKVVDDLCKQAFAEESAPASAVIEEPTKPEAKGEIAGETQLVGRFQVPKVFNLIAGIVLSLILIFTIFTVIEKMNAYSKEEALPKSVISEESTSPLPAEEELESNLEKNSELAINKSKDSGKAKEKTSEKKTVVKKVSNDKSANSASSAAPASVQPKDNVSAEDFTEDNFGDADSSTVVVSDNKLTLMALEPVRAEIVWSDGFVQVMLLKSRESKTLVFSQPITLRVNNGGAIQVSFNNSESKVPGSLNQPIELKFP